MRSFVYLALLIAGVSSSSDTCSAGRRAPLLLAKRSDISSSSSSVQPVTGRSCTSDSQCVTYRAGNRSSSSTAPSSPKPRLG
ncbi:hypothetical protein GGH94_005086, partial [Coemansia aciculifera]